jgi:hypothetical protein
MKIGLILDNKSFRAQFYDFNSRVGFEAVTEVVMTSAM